jgi:hypothetical protein
VQQVRAPWTSSSFLLYAGGIAILLSMLGFLGSLAGDYGDAALTGWAALVFAVLAFLALSFRTAGRPIVAGLFSVSAVVAAAVLVGALEAWFGWLAHTDTPFAGFHLDHFLIELVLVVAAFVALRLFHFPLLALFAVGGSWFFVTDVLSSGGDWSATVTLVIGLILMAVGVGVDRIYGFWVHVVAGLTIGGALLWFSHSSDTDWVLIGLASLLYVSIASGLARSSYAVLGAFGLVLTTSHFIDKWFAYVPFPFFSFFFSRHYDGSTNPRPWATALSYAVYGLVLMLLGLWVARRRQPPEPT